MSLSIASLLAFKETQPEGGARLSDVFLYSIKAEVGVCQGGDLGNAGLQSPASVIVRPLLIVPPKHRLLKQASI